MKSESGADDTLVLARGAHQETNLENEAPEPDREPKILAIAVCCAILILTSTCTALSADDEIANAEPNQLREAITEPSEDR